MHRATVLVVDDEPGIRWTLTQRLRREGYDTVEAETVAEALARFDGVDVALLDYTLPDGDGLAILKRIKESDPDILVMLLTANTDIDVAVSAMRQGAFHYVSKPFNTDEVLVYVEQALETTRLRRELRTLRATQSRPFGVDRLVGASPAMDSVRALLLRIAASPASTVLVLGESGTGKDLAAHVIHYASARASKPFVNITCSALTDTLLESELFGHERGAFTGADRLRRGLLETADGGTVFLDEIGEMTPMLQAKLLRVLEEKAFKRVGGTTDVRVDVRVVAATNRQLEDEVKQGRFREDLFYRLNVLPVTMPSLRQRPEDVVALATHFVDQFNRDFHKQVTAIAESSRAALRAYAWPGNVRELRNVIERAMLLTDGSELVVASGAGQASSGGGPYTLPDEGVDLEQVERSLVEQALARAGWHQAKAAALLGLNRDQMRYRIEKFKLTRPS